MQHMVLYLVDYFHTFVDSLKKNARPEEKMSLLRTKTSQKLKIFWKVVNARIKKNKKKGPLSIFAISHRKYTKNGQLFPK